MKMKSKQLRQILSDFQAQKNPEKAKLFARFFKTGKGHYGEGDIFLGLMVPEQRILAKKYASLSFEDLNELLSSRFHEHRLTALLILTYQYENADKKADEKKKKEIYDFYLSNKKSINNWDLVDVTCPRIVGEYLYKRNAERKILYNFARSDNLWEKRIGIVSTLYFIKKNDLQDTLKISEILMHDRHDLIHKAVGWMLREVGKQDEKTLRNFLDLHAGHMPRTMLRYSIERLDLASKKKYMSKRSQKA